jgi:hypothetical protein
VPSVWKPAGRGVRFVFLAALFLAGAGARAQETGAFWNRELEAMPGARATAPESRVGQVFWFQSQGRPFSPDFFHSRELDKRLPVAGKRRFVVTALTRGGAREEGAPVYQVRIEPWEDAFIPVDSFEAHLYVDPPAQSETRLRSDLYLSPQAHFFSLKSIFSEDPELLWERIRVLGPSRIRPPTPAPTPKPEGYRLPE